MRRSDREYDKLVEGASFADAVGIHLSRGGGLRSSREALRNMFSQYAFLRLQLRRKEPRVNIVWSSGVSEKEAESEEGRVLITYSVYMSEQADGLPAILYTVESRERYVLGYKPSDWYCTFSLSRSFKK